MKEIRLEFD